MARWLACAASTTLRTTTALNCTRTYTLPAREPPCPAARRADRGSEERPPQCSDPIATTVEYHLLWKQTNESGGCTTFCARLHTSPVLHCAAHHLNLEALEDVASNEGKEGRPLVALWLPHCGQQGSPCTYVQPNAQPKAACTACWVPGNHGGRLDAPPSACAPQTASPAAPPSAASCSAWCQGPSPAVRRGQGRA